MMYKRYITRRRARFQSLNGVVNLPWGTAAEKRDGFLWRGDKLLCAASAQNTKDFFVQDDDGQGETRGRLVTAILACLDPQEARQGASNARWEKIWADRRCRAYKRPDLEEHWIWTEDFYNAPIGDLQHIADLVGAKI
ncbi:isoaspartyl peptidase [Acutalibacter sp. 1XD8-33]|nr:isoaspartyl peptidase [Acutalibacter sp. 1XD8-33]